VKIFCSKVGNGDEKENFHFVSSVCALFSVVENFPEKIHEAVDQGLAAEFGSAVGAVSAGEGGG
jgi:hypothetical protein